MIPEHPILFSVDMMRANQRHEKSVTRRTAGLKGIPPHAELVSKGVVGDRFCATFRWMDGNREVVKTAKCPYGKPGGYLWVREAHLPQSKYRNLEETYYRADRKEDEWKRFIDQKEVLHFPIKFKWIPGIHMKRKGSRMLLEAVCLDLEHLHDITEEECINEGMRRAFLEEWVERHYKEPTEHQHWLVGEGSDHGLSYCYNCGEKARKRFIKEHDLDPMDVILDEGRRFFESDTPACCDFCHKGLTYEFTDFGAEQEWNEYRAYCFNKSNVFALDQIFESGIDLPDFGMTCFRSFWGQLNGDESWGLNPWLWTVRYRILEGGLF